MGKSEKGEYRKGKPDLEKKHPLALSEMIRWLIEIAGLVIELLELFK